ncbi:unnamed protein product, partial [Allacma fusca]
KFIRDEAGQSSACRLPDDLKDSISEFYILRILE